MNPRRKVIDMLSGINQMILYHGGTIEVKQIDLSKSRASLDFGKGFYTTSSYEQACRWSVIKYNREKNNIDKAKVVSKYSFASVDELNIKEFKNATRDWLEFIVANRNSKVPIHDYDLVISPIADDTTLFVINAYMNGVYGSGENAVQIAVSLLKPEILENQYAFCTLHGISNLKYEGCDFL